ncbi:MAG: hypothetical protein ACK5PB_07240 [Pirellula sp.]
MNESQSAYLSFSNSPAMIASSMVVLLVAFAIGYWNASNSQWRRSVVLLEIMRFSIVTAIVILFNQPEWTQEFRPLEKPRLVVLVDRSQSMETRDVLPTGATAKVEAQTRRESADRFVQPETWADLSNIYNVQIEPFSSGVTSGSGTDIHASLESVLESSQRTAAVVLVSDGDWNRGKPPVDSAIRYRSRGVPIFTVPMGSSTRLPDLEVLSLDLPTFAISGKSVRIPFSIESTLPRDHVTTVVIEIADGERLTKEVKLTAKSKTTESVVWLPKSTGDFTVKMSVPNHPEEVIFNNNEITAPISIREEKLKVLVIDSLPRWEYRYLRNALSRDPGVDVSCLLFHPTLGRTGGGTKDYIKDFPDQIEQLAEYDVVFLGDVGIQSGQLTSEQCKLLKGLVEYQASGLVFLPGPQGNQDSLEETELAPLIPVITNRSLAEGIGEKTPMHFELTESGRRSLLTKLADTEEENWNVWSTLPGFQWYAPVIRAKAGTEVLSVHQETNNEYGRLPMIVTKTFGAGKILYMATDGAWRWRRGVEDKYHYRFWGQVVRWMAYQRNMAKGELIRFFYSPEQPSVGQTLALKASVMSQSGEPLVAGEVQVAVTDANGKTEITTLSSAGEDSWGLFEGRMTITEPGKHQVTVSCRETGAKLNTSFFAQGTSQERIGLAAKPKVLEELSKVSRGAVIPAQDLTKLTQIIKEVPDPPTVVKRWQLWAHPWTVGVLTTLLATFWVLRKQFGLV